MTKTNQTIICPSCGHEFELGGALENRIRKSLQVEIEAATQKKEKQLEESKIEFEQKKSRLDAEISSRVQSELKQLADEERRKAKDEIGLELEAAQKELESQRRKLKESEKQELDLRRQKQELEDKQEALDLEVERKLDEGRRKIANEATVKAAEQQILKIREKDNLIKSLSDKVGALQRQIDVGSQERQGEALEGELIDMLRSRFPIDQCEEVKKGARGGDVVQRVRNDVAKQCGAILWESKNTKSFKPEWIEKLKKDQQEAGADLAVLVTIALPGDVVDFDFYHGIWVTSFDSAMSLCSVLRQMLISIQRQKLVVSHQEGMKDIIYQYITGREFSLHVKMIVSAYQLMQADLESEKRSMQKIWKKREKQITTVLDNVTGLYGEIEGLLGDRTALPDIEILSLDAIANDDDEESS